MGKRQKKYFTWWIMANKIQFAMRQIDEQFVEMTRTDKHTKRVMIMNGDIDKFDFAFDKIENGEYVDDAFCFLSAEERNFIVNGVVPKN